MAFSTQARIEAVLGRSLTASELVNLTGLQLQADNWLIKRLHLEFSSTPSSRYYDGGNTVLAIDSCRSISAVELVDDNLDVVVSYTVDEDYVAGPENDTVKSYLVKTLSFPELVIGETYDGVWPRGLKNIKVTATYGLADSVPEDLAALASYMVAKVISIPLEGVLQSEQIEGYSRSYATQSGFKTVSTVSSEYWDNDPKISLVIDSYDGDQVLF